MYLHKNELHLAPKNGNSIDSYSLDVLHKAYLNLDVSLTWLPSSRVDLLSNLSPTAINAG